ncbi:glycoside hydrolase family 32 protein [Arthrobacter sp. STN4]|uniref:glycoside hydrolase family 32 protein n=1 Tax=Arthrobacter sp. STN4 TaxID=2923276 RepID=UPI00277B5105|nr:glycoside hydrolase family 32 protein [Arthrobacter sp. STN4]
MTSTTMPDSSSTAIAGTAIASGDRPQDRPSNLAREHGRPAFHYTARDTWINDPNGLILHNGIYHLFYQNNPRGSTWGNMSWGHATSVDLLHWTEHAPAIVTDACEDIFSGSVVFDASNSSGLGTAETPALVAIYTSAFKQESEHCGEQAQSLALSLDGGYTWARHPANPVLTRNSANFRDPKVFWYGHGPEACWVMVAVEAQERKAVFYKSGNLTDWEFLSEFGPENATGGVWECPDLFELPVEGAAGATKWVLTINLNPGAVSGGSGGQYFIGHFDGTTFVPESTVTQGLEPDPDCLRRYGWLDWGRDYYAAVSFNGVPGGRRIMVGWMNNWDYGADIPTDPWRGAMALPREVRLRTIDGRIRLTQSVATEVLQAGGAEPSYTAVPGPIEEGRHLLPVPAHGTAQRIDVDFTPGTASTFGLIVRAGAGGVGTKIGYDTASASVVVDRTASGDTGFNPSFASIEHAPVALAGGHLKLGIHLDSTSVEVFSHDGLTTLTEQIFPPDTAREVWLYAEGGTAQLHQLTTTPFGN